MTNAETILVAPFEQQTGGAARLDEPTRQLVRQAVMPDNDGRELSLLGLGEKVAALGGHLEIRALVDDGELTPIREPGSEGQLPILQDTTTPPLEDPPVAAFRGADDASVPVEGDLTEHERDVIVGAMVEWTSPGRMSRDRAVAIGFGGVDRFHEQLDRLISAVDEARPLIALDCKRGLLATEVCYASDYFGAGWEWETVTCVEDYASLLALRDIQEKLIGIAKQVPPPLHDLPTAAEFAEGGG